MTASYPHSHDEAIVDPGAIPGPSRGVRATPGRCRADQCRELGLEVGDTIEGRSEFNTGYWTEARLTLLWIGNQMACFLVSERNIAKTDWSEPHESCAWTLEWREWRRAGWKAHGAQRRLRRERSCACCGAASADRLDP